MYKRTYLSPEEKIQAVEEYLGGIGSLNQTAKKWEVHRSTFQKWLLNYEMFGGEGLYPRRENQYYSETLKRQAVELYLSGRASEGEVCKKYRIRSRTQLEQWISWYHGQKGFHPAGGTRRGTQMTRNYETDKAKLVEETVWQRMVAGNLGFDAETHYPETMMELDLGAEEPKWELRSADELRREDQKGHQSLREKYGKG